MKVELTQGKAVVLDDMDAHLIAGYHWYAARFVRGSVTLWYAVAAIAGHRNVRMHRLILDAPTGVMVDHANGNGLDNHRSNLRLATSSQNAQNRRAHGRSCFRGVSFHPQSGKWRVRVREAGGRYHSGGLWATEEEAALAYNELARQHHGPFAKLNVVDR